MVAGHFTGAEKRREGENEGRKEKREVRERKKKINREQLPRTWSSYMEKLFRKDLPAMVASKPRAEGCQ